VSLDFGLNWRLVEESVKSVAWDESVVPTTLYLGRGEPNKLVTVLSSTSLFRNPEDTHVLLTDVEEFDVKDEYIFATKRNAVSHSIVIVFNSSLVSRRKSRFKNLFCPKITYPNVFKLADSLPSYLNFFDEL